MTKYKDEMITVPDIGNTQAYSDDESPKATKIAQRMHNFIVNKTVLEPKVPIPVIKCKLKHFREIDEEEGNNKIIYSEDEWVFQDNNQQLTSIKRNKKDDHNKDPDGMYHFGI
jgi:maltodextrin utilization protein YvdJ